ncbi:MAG: hypothetical protein HZA82_00345 [Thaumarchaeota archaeon]|nr:hypothetical protein [Nitrososphaerota archaeon]
MTQELDNRRIAKIMNALTLEQQKELDLGLQITEKDKELYKKLAKT